jgi:hypothetical protein
MRVKHYQLAGVLMLFLAMMPNITWVLYLPVMLVFIIYAIYLTKISLSRMYFLMSLLGAMLLLSIFMPNSTLYNMLFFLIVLYSLAFSDLIKNPRFLNFALDFGSYFILLTILVGGVLPIGHFLQSRPDFDLHLLGFLRQRGIYSEPSNLGYWAAWLAYLSLINRRSRSLVLYFVALFLASSVGALLFFVALLFTHIQNFKRRDGFILAIFGAIVFFYLFDQIVGKLSLEDTASIMLRLENAKLAFDFIQHHFPFPAGFGPMVVEGEKVGITSFVLLLLKALGVTIIFVLIIFWKLRAEPLTILPVLLISAAVGNFWETPILIVVLYFLLKKKTKLSLFCSSSNPIDRRHRELLI